jgi:hypothetical protein
MYIPPYYFEVKNSTCTNACLGYAENCGVYLYEFQILYTPSLSFVTFLINVTMISNTGHVIINNAMIPATLCSIRCRNRPFDFTRTDELLYERRKDRFDHEILFTNTNKNEKMVECTKTYIHFEILISCGETA